MKKSEASEALTFCAAFDQRTIGNADVEAWALALADLPWDQSTREAIANFYTAPSADYDRDSRRFIQPHHVRTGRSRLRNERLSRVIEPVPNTVEGVDTHAELRALRRAIGDGRIKDQADAQAYTDWGGSLHLAYERGETPALTAGPNAQPLRQRPVTQAITGSFQRVPGGEQR